MLILKNKTPSQMMPAVIKQEQMFYNQTTSSSNYLDELILGSGADSISHHHDASHHHHHHHNHHSLFDLNNNAMDPMDIEDMDDLDDLDDLDDSDDSDDSAGAGDTDDDDDDDDNDDDNDEDENDEDDEDDACSLTSCSSLNNSSSDSPSSLATTNTNSTCSTPSKSKNPHLHHRHQHRHHHRHHHKKSGLSASMSQAISQTSSTGMPSGKKMKKSKQAGLDNNGGNQTLAKQARANRFNSMGYSSDNPAEKRAFHILSERQRRNDLKKLFETLRVNIPTLGDKQKASKLTILKAAVDHLVEVGNRRERLHTHFEKEKLRNAQLLQHLKSLQSDDSSMSSQLPHSSLTGSQISYMPSFSLTNGCQSQMSATLAVH
jgi:hypothetical protein